MDAKNVHLLLTIENQVRELDPRLRSLDEEIGRVPFSSKWHRERGHWLRGVTASLLRMLSRVGLLRWLCGYRYVMAPTHIFMIGELPES